MQIVRESIKFTRGLDPKRAMGIGIFTPRPFYTIESAIKWLMPRIPFILNTSEIPEDIFYMWQLPRNKKTWEQKLNKDYSTTLQAYIDNYMINETPYSNFTRSENNFFVKN